MGMPLLAALLGLLALFPAPLSAQVDKAKVDEFFRRVNDPKYDASVLNAAEKLEVQKGLRGMILTSMDKGVQASNTGRIGIEFLVYKLNQVSGRQVASLTPDGKFLETPNGPSLTVKEPSLDDIRRDLEAAKKDGFSLDEKRRLQIQLEELRAYRASVDAADIDDFTLDEMSQIDDDLAKAMDAPTAASSGDPIARNEPPTLRPDNSGAAGEGWPNSGGTAAPSQKDQADKMLSGSRFSGAEKAEKSAERMANSLKSELPSSDDAEGGAGGAGGGSRQRGPEDAKTAPASAPPRLAQPALSSDKSLLLAAASQGAALQAEGLAVRGDKIVRTDGSPASEADLARLKDRISKEPEALTRNPSFFDPARGGIERRRFNELKDDFKGRPQLRDTEFRDINLSAGDRDFLRSRSCELASGECNTFAEKSYKQGDDVPPKDLNGIWTAINSYIKNTAGKTDPSGGKELAKAGPRPARALEGALNRIRGLFSGGGRGSSPEPGGAEETQAASVVGLGKGPAGGAGLAAVRPGAPSAADRAGDSTAPRRRRSRADSSRGGAARALMGIAAGTGAALMIAAAVVLFRRKP